MCVRALAICPWEKRGAQIRMLLSLSSRLWSLQLHIAVSSLYLCFPVLSYVCAHRVSKQGSFPVEDETKTRGNSAAAPW